MTTYTYQAARQQALDAVRAALDSLAPGAAADLSLPASVPPAGVAADLAVPCFALAARLRQPPAEVARRLAEAVGAGPLVAEARAEGGYLNIAFDRPPVARGVLDELAALGGRYGSTDAGGGRAVVIDYSSPNVAKPMSVGHLRSTIIGDALYRLFAFTGYRPVGVNHIADWGTQFGKLLYAFLTWGDREAYRRDPLRELLRVYVQFEREAERDASLEERGREWSLRLEQGDPQARALWREFVDHSLAAFNRIYDLLEVRFDHVLGESFYADKVGEVIEMALRAGVAVEDEGALIIRLDDVGISTPLVLRRRDGATLYVTRDLAAAIYRIRTWNPVQLIYVVGSEQRLHFQQLFAALRKLGFTQVTYAHVDFGLITLPEGRMSTRRGRVVFLEDVLSEAIARARALVDAKNPELPEDERAEVARIVGIGALKYADLSQNRVKNITFDWDRMLSLEGDSAPYLQYTYVRARGILRRGGAEALEGPFDPRVAEGAREWALLRSLGRFPDVVWEATHTYSPHLVANHLYDLAQAFHAFYHEVPVLQTPDPGLRATRVRLVAGVATVMRTGLGLLGIRVPERM
ncbi:MAG: arginine--tRNA ligase [Armatimonadota bacterium]|nr:arginine--tRNA ligase [Armatimonadota bacterium]MDR7401913.1 arginine--tRNA ligase [Armatimonadota bacterium]MDR7404817.1 arginine--tRNA ligase [Armatimonadota bacterium]MDR7438104.1 arginine--tRNA ligase [Armatimonadota bacterium]MDR7471536.1 arginine--tRNA ligase [Armatimonadota bacterium]